MSGIAGGSARRSEASRCCWKGRRILQTLSEEAVFKAPSQQATNDFPAVDLPNAETLSQDRPPRTGNDAPGHHTNLTVAA